MSQSIGRFSSSVAERSHYAGRDDMKTLFHFSEIRKSRQRLYNMMALGSEIIFRFSYFFFHKKKLDTEINFITIFKEYLFSGGYF